MKKKPTKRPRQPKLPNMEDVSIPEIDDAAAEYVDARDNRMRLLKEETEAGDKLLALMKEKKLDSYQYDGQVVTVAHLDKVKVKRANAENGEETEE